jgi:C_GCAxxG_C_C family probable redox protein
MMSEVSIAVERFKSGCACSQAVCGTYGPRYGLDEKLAMRVAAGFAGGMRVAGTCGAVTGALMVLSLAHCSDNCRTAPERQAAYAAALTFFEQFKKRHGSLSCRELLGCDISTPEGNRVAVEQGLFRSKCVDLVHDAALILEDMLPQA